MLSVVITAAALFSFKTSALSLSYSGSSSSNGTGASATTSGYSISYDDANKNICGYRFSIVSSNGLPKSGTQVANIYLCDLTIGSNAYFGGQRFIVSANVVANKKQLANGMSVTSSSTTQYCDYYSTACGFYSNLPQAPGSIGSWIKNSNSSYLNLQRIYYYCNSNLANATESDYVLIEPIFSLKLAGTQTAATATELAIYGAAVSGGDGYKGTDGNLYNAGSGTLWNLSNYINREFPNTLYVSSKTDVYSAITINTSSKYTYKQIIGNGYGCSVLTVKNVIPIKKVYIAYHPNGGTVTTATNTYGWVQMDGVTYFHSIAHGKSDDPRNPSTFGMKRTGYTFIGWEVNSTGTILDPDVEYASTVYAQHDDASKTTANTSEVYCQLIAKWKVNKVELAYHPNGGVTNTELNAYGWIKLNDTVCFDTLEYGESDDPYNASTFGLKRTGYTFVGWEVYSTGKLLDENTEYDSTVYAHHSDSSLTTANKNAVVCYLYAKWEVNEVSLAYHPNGGTTDTELNQYGWIMLDGTVYFDKLKYGEADDPYNASTFGLKRPGYKFAGWRVESTGAILDENTVYDSTVYAHASDSSKTTANTHEVTCYLQAEWEKRSYTNTISHWATGFNGNGNSDSKNAFRLGDTTFTKEYKQVFYLNEDYAMPIPNGYYLPPQYGTSAFVGTWTAYPFNTEITQTAKNLWFEYDYLPIEYNITYNLDGGENDENNPDNYNILNGVILNNPQKNNANFLGWDIKMSKDIFLSAMENNWNYDFVLYDLKPGTDYNIAIDEAKITSGTATEFTCLIYDFTTGSVLAQKETPFGKDINFTLSCPETADATHDICLLVYAGVTCYTSGNAVTYDNISVKFESDGVNQGCDSNFSSADDLYAKLERRIACDIEFTAKWENNDIFDLVILPIEPNAPYRENTEVITSYWIVNCAATDIIPSHNISAIMTVYENDDIICVIKKHNIVIPEMDKNLVYFNWNVPNTITEDKVRITCVLTIDSVEDESVTDEYSIIPFNYYSTPDTRYQKKAPDGFSVPSAPVDNSESGRWWQWEYTGSSYALKQYAITTGTNDISLHAPLAPSSYMESGNLHIKSGYGFECCFTPKIQIISGYDTDSTRDCNPSQYCYALFPEYNYSSASTKCRTFKFMSEKISFNPVAEMQNLHFIPLYYPDGKYQFQIVMSDCWTPAGMIKTNQIATLYIDGNIYDDWYIQH